MSDFPGKDFIPNDAYAVRRLGSLRAYFSIAFSITWATWFFVAFAPQLHIAIPTSMFFPILVVWSFGPFIASFSLKLREGGLRAAGEFAGRALRFQIGLPYLLCALVLLPLIGAAATELYAMIGGHALLWRYRQVRFHRYSFACFFSAVRSARNSAGRTPPTL